MACQEIRAFGLDGAYRFQIIGRYFLDTGAANPLSTEVLRETVKRLIAA
jgi:hypothetical protein